MDAFWLNLLKPLKHKPEKEVFIFTFLLLVLLFLLLNINSNIFLNTFKVEEGEPETKKRRIELEINQEGGGDPTDEEEGEQGEIFQIVRPLENNYFTLEVMSTRSFKNLNAVQEVTYKAKLKNSPQKQLLNNMIPNLYGLFESVLEELRET